MKKLIKKMLGAALAIALCIAMLPAQTAKAASYSYLVDFGEANFSTEQLMEAYFGTWDNSTILSKDGIVLYSFNWDTYEDELVVETTWEYVETIVKVGLMKNMEDYHYSAAALALKFRSEENEWLVYKNYDPMFGNRVITISKMDLEGNTIASYDFTFKDLPEEEYEDDRPYRIQYIMQAIAERDGI